MSIVKANRIVGSNAPLPEVDGLMTRQVIFASSDGQTEFNITLFNDDVNIRAFVSNEEVAVSWVDGVAVLEEGVAAGTQVDFYGFGNRFSGGSESFIGLTDTPAAYAGFEGYHVRVKADGTGLEFVNEIVGGTY